MPEDDRSPADGSHPFERGAVAVAEIVDHDDIEPGVE
jgi:hypothetical protein